MLPTQQGSFRFFRFKGIDVHVHWSWFIVAIISVSTRLPAYTAPIWAVLEYLTLFLAVLLHEFGHSLACRQVGGSSDQIVLWPLGGVAFVDPPPRPGATLWSIAAGPLVNVVLLPIFVGLFYACEAAGALQGNPDLVRFLRAIIVMDLSLLVFNLLPVYPLDGGQILRSLLWYPLGKARSLFVATIIGFVGGAALAGVAIWIRSIWFGIMAFFLLSNCWSSFQQARALRRIERFPRRPAFACPSCHSSPPIGEFWLCEGCGHPFDLFAKATICPRCNATQTRVGCVDCGSVRSYTEWTKDEAVVI